MTTIEIIYNNLQNGYSYGKYRYNVMFPYFDIVLSLDATKTFIRWRHFGSSANRNTIEELQWILSEIFKMTPEEFEDEYICEEA